MHCHKGQTYQDCNDKTYASPPRAAFHRPTRTERGKELFCLSSSIRQPLPSPSRPFSTGAPPSAWDSRPLDCTTCLNAFSLSVKSLAFQMLTRTWLHQFSRPIIDSTEEFPPFLPAFPLPIIAKESTKGRSPIQPKHSSHWQRTRTCMGPLTEIVASAGIKTAEERFPVPLGSWRFHF
jgi:hypothetical protein